MRQTLPALSIALILAVAQGTCAAAQTLPGTAAVSVQPPTGATLLLRASGEGVQIYTCTRKQDAWGWQLKAPEATLLDAAGKPIGKHTAGPRWQLDDGSAVEGTLITTHPQGTAIPWLLLSARSTGSTGVLDAARYVNRTDTVGGRAPDDGCDAKHEAAETRVRYSATYSFYSGGK